MKKLLNIILLFAIVLNSFGQSKIKKDIVEAEEELIIEGVDFVDWLADSTASANARDAGSGMSLDGNDIDLGGTLDKTTEIAAAGNSIDIGTFLSRANTISLYSSNGVAISDETVVAILSNADIWVFQNGLLYNTATGDTLTNFDDVRALIESAEQILPFNFDYTFSSSITDSRPGVGLFKFNNATLSNVTEVYIDYFDANSVAKNNFLELADTGSFITVLSDVNNYAIYQLTGVLTDAGNYFKYAVTYSSHSGVISGLSTIDLEMNNTTGSGGGGTAISEHAYFDTISSHNNSFVLFDSAAVAGNITVGDTLFIGSSDNIKIYEINPGGNSGVIIEANDGDQKFSSADNLIGMDSKGSGIAVSTVISPPIISFISSSSDYYIRGDTLYMDGSEVISGTPSVDGVIKTGGISVGGAEVVDTTYSSKDAMEGTVVDSIQVTKTIRYNTSEGVHEFLTGKDEVVWQGALEDLFQFYNNTGQTIANGTPLYYSGVNGDSILTCDYATANIEFTVLRYAGLATGDVPNANWGFGNVRGKVRDYNTTGLSQVGAVFLGNDSLPTMTKPAYPSQVLILGGVIDVATDGILYHDPSFALQRELESRDYSFTTQGILSGIYYRGGYYDWSATDANLTQASTTQAYGTISVAYSAHASVVVGSAGSTDAGVVGLRVTGTSIDDNGVRTAVDADTIITDITAVATDEYYESKKWIGIVTYELITMSGSPTTYSLDFNYGYAKYEDANNNDYYLVGLECVGLAGANDTDFNIELLHHKSTGWTYAATGFIAGNGAIASWGTDLAPEDNLSSGENFAWKRSNLSTFIDGNGSEGGIFRITTGSSAAVQSMDMHILIALE